MIKLAMTWMRLNRCVSIYRGCCDDGRWVGGKGPNAAINVVFIMPVVADGSMTGRFDVMNKTY